MEIPYEVEELAEVVAMLAEEYTSKESSSITYEKAEQLMEAVLYCIHQLEQGKNTLQAEKLPAKRAYSLGYQIVVEKVKDALCFYNELMSEFSHYGNRCLYDTMVKGIPEFFKWYDPRFFPQNTILCLDYPIREDLTQYSGIDRIYAYLRCVKKEQEELEAMGEDYVIGKLRDYSEDYEELVENLMELIQWDRKQIVE